MADAIDGLFYSDGDASDFSEGSDRQEAGWYFWDEIGLYFYGPYKSEEEARQALSEYIRDIIG